MESHYRPVPRQRQRFAHQSSRVSARPTTWLVLLLLCFALVACADDDSNRRFANEPPPTEGAVTTATGSGGVQVTSTSTVSAASPIPVTQLLASPGGASTVVTQVDADLVAIAPPWTA